MNILAIDTSSKMLCLGVVNHRQKRVGYNLDSGKRHTGLLLPTIKKALARSGVRISQVDYFAVGLGPGSFTGLRIGLATMKGFAQAMNVPVIGLPTLDILAGNALAEKGRIICPLIDAKRNLVFTAWYESDAHNRLKRGSPYLLISIEELLKRLKPYKGITFLGDGLLLHQRLLMAKKRGSIFLNEDNWYPKAKILINQALDSAQRGRFKEAGRIKPIYLYPKECQVKN
ncbi:tRNA (adenosine(37)-N6)-threonylcarbamoyltransferase complex dimerization subunit type 1 TsaB [Candidatus Omnitrophota bacterium]